MWILYISAIQMGYLEILRITHKNLNKMNTKDSMKSIVADLARTRTEIETLERRIMKDILLETLKDNRRDNPRQCTISLDTGKYQGVMNAPNIVQCYLDDEDIMFVPEGYDSAENFEFESIEELEIIFNALIPR